MRLGVVLYYDVCAGRWTANARRMKRTGHFQMAVLSPYHEYFSSHPFSLCPKSGEES